uniref:Chloroplast protein-transporting ATPase n=1 Tax=Panagrolaimus davidi TaxID=227884 RepID=A0A914PYW7_9BILA
MGTSAATKRFLAQVNTGEGKSFVIAAIAIIQAKTLGTVDIITSSSVLAKRDSEELTDIYKEFDLTVSHNCDENTEKRKISYKANVVYGDIASFQRDYLLHTFYKKNILGDRQRKIVIVDEVDNMLLDNGNNMLYLSHQVAGMERMDSLFVFIHKLVHMPLINSQMKTKEIEVEFDTKMIKEKVMIDLTGKLDIKYLDDKILTDKIVQTAWNKLVELEIINRDGYLNKLSDAGFELVKKDLEAELGKCCPQPLVSRILVCLKVIVNRERFISVPDYLKDFCILHLDEYIESCKKSMFLKHKNEYVIDVDHTREDSDLQPKVTIVDQNTGVDLSNSQWSEGLHQCVQLKHGCRLLPITLKAVFISNVLFLKGYEIINGLSGTLGSAEESQALADLYEAKLIRIPTSK